MLTNLLPILSIAIPSIIALGIFSWMLSLRRIVPTNVVHIVQRGKKTVSYGVGKTSNVYYEFPIWFPIIGVETRELPVSNFDIDLNAYSAYDQDRVPFVVDVKAFFHIADTNVAAEKVNSFPELKTQLEYIVQGAVRSILAKSKLEEIMEERSIFGQKFTDAVADDLSNWGVSHIKSIELMDVRDEKGSQVIQQIMDKKMSAIAMESRVEVAANRRDAQKAELDAQKEIDVRAADTQREAGEAHAKSKQAIGVADANSDKVSGIARQSAISDIAKAEKITAEEKMKVIEVEQVRQAEIDKKKEIINADLEKRQVEINAEAQAFNVEKAAQAALSARRNEAEGVREIGNAEAAVTLAKGTSAAESKKLDQLAGVTAETTLAEKVGENEGYQNYLIRRDEVEANKIVGIAQQEALGKSLSSADLKVLVNSGDVNTGINGIADLLSSKGGSQLNGVLEALKHTDEGQKILGMIKGVTEGGASVN